MKHKKWKTYMILFSLLIIPMLILTACSSNNSGGTIGKESSSGNGKVGKIVFADAKWDSIEFHNWVARTILEDGYGYKTGVETGSTAATILGLKRGDIDVYMEVWKLSVGKAYQDALDSGKVKQVGINYADDEQGLYVPTYMIKGDPKRGIKATAPDLKSVKDLPKYWKLFKDPSDPGKGRIVGSPTGWEADKSLQKWMKDFNLKKTYNYFSPGSQTALVTSMQKAYKAGKPWVGYGWTPTWFMAKFDMTLLKAPKYTKKCWKSDKACAFPNDKVAIAVNSDFAKKAPKVVKFLKNYHSSSDLTNQALLYMQKNNAKPKEAAKWWLKTHTKIWTKWVPDNVAKKVKKAVQ